MDNNTSVALIADIGGTNARFAVVEIATGLISQVRVYACEDYLNIEQAIKSYQLETGYQFEIACLAVASQVDNDDVKFTNNHWYFSKRKLADAFKFKHFYVINDFTAIALSIPFLDDSEKHQIGGGQPQPEQPIAVFGAGTGLGVAHLLAVNGEWLALEGEGGHVNFAADTEDEREVLNYLKRQYDRVSAERVLSGKGLELIYQSFCEANGQAEPIAPSAEEISNRALSHQEHLAEKTLDLFFGALASFGGDLALNLATKGGVYIAGGIVPRYLQYIDESNFRARFENKHPLQLLLSDIPLYIVTAKQPGLRGCEVFLRQKLAS